MGNRDKYKGNIYRKNTLMAIYMKNICIYIEKILLDTDAYGEKTHIKKKHI